jgi:ribosome-associated protein
MTSLEKAYKIKDILDSKKAVEINILHVHDKSVISDYFVIATGTSSTHVKSLADEVESELEKLKVLPLSHAGKLSNSWVLLDYGDVIVHIFSQEARDFYDLEKLWSK